MANQPMSKTNTSTQIRNMYSDSMSCMNIKFYNTNLSFQLYPFVQKDSTGKSEYDTKHGQQTTVNYEGAYALYQACKDIIDGKSQEMNMNVPCLGATLTLERKLGLSGQLETVFTINKNNMSIPFKFQTIQYQAKENGQVVQKTIETGLGAFMSTIKGYLEGVNSDRHLDKLTEDYAKLNENNANDSNKNFNRNNGNNNNYRRNYNGNGGNNYRQRNNWNNNGPAQNMNDYSLS